MPAARLRALCALAVGHVSQDSKEATTPPWLLQHLHRISPRRLPPCTFVSRRCAVRITTPTCSSDFAAHVVSSQPQARALLVVTPSHGPSACYGGPGPRAHRHRFRPAGASLGVTGTVCSPNVPTLFTPCEVAAKSLVSDAT